MAQQVLLIQGAGEGAHEQDAKLAKSLRNQLGKNYRVRYPAMPDEGDADYETWKSAILREIEDMGDGAILVGHSIGASVLICAGSRLLRPALRSATDALYIESRRG